jgi:DNA-binding transcriptional LysR family regulator
MNFTLKQLEAFVWVCDLGSFRKAAQRLNTTQPNISTRIAALEDLLDIRLLERDAGSVRLTTKGREVLLQARQVLRDTERLLEVAGRSHTTSGTLKLGVTELIVNTWLRDFMRQAKKDFPNVSIELTIDLSVRISDALMANDIDLALQSSPFAQPVENTLVLGTYPYVWVTAPTIARQLATSSLPSLLSFPILTHARGTLAVEEIETYIRRSGGAPVRVVPSSNMSACLHMAVDGLGIAVLPEAMVRDDVKRKRLQVVSHAWQPKPLKMCARYKAVQAPAYVGQLAKLAKSAALRFDTKISV